MERQKFYGILKAWQISLICMEMYYHYTLSSSFYMTKSSNMRNLLLLSPLMAMVNGAYRSFSCDVTVISAAILVYRIQLRNSNITQIYNSSLLSDMDVSKCEQKSDKKPDLSCFLFLTMLRS